MSRRFRDLVVTLTALLVLFILLISISPRLRERAGEFAGGGSERQWDASRSVVGHTMDTAMAMATGYASQNTYLFAFLFFASVLFVLMLRT